MNKEIPLSLELEFFYKYFEVICDINSDGHELPSASIELGVSPMNLWSFENLNIRQEGFRWTIVDNCRVKNPSWDESWLVIADKDDDPIVVVTNKNNSPVIASYEAGDFSPIAGSFADFLDYIADGQSEWVG